MENNAQMMELLQQIERTSRRQLRLERLRCLFTLVAALCCIALVVMAMTVLPQVGDLITRTELALNNLEETAAQLSELDLEGMITSVDELMTMAQETLTETAGMFDKLDVETMNRAISDLAAVVEPLARLFR